MFEHDTSVSGRLFRIWYNLSHVRMWESHSYASLSLSRVRKGKRLQCARHKFLWLSGRLFRIWYNLSHVRMWESQSYASLSVTCARGQVIEKLERCLPHGPGLGRRKFEPRTIRLVSWCDVDLIADHVELFVTSNLHAHACSRACSVDCGPCVS